MNFSLARDCYTKDRAIGYADPADSHEVITVTLRELRRSIDVLACPEPAAREVRDAHLTRALTAVYILQTSLDFDRGGEIAANLYRIYEYFRTQLLRAFRREPELDLSRSRELIDEIIEAWVAIRRPGAVE
jgi:flagellar protein FliS